ncbi:ArnT family glycosyltransferase [Halalkalibaculum sp. DA384]|uniref:ArnT family glycosyltransferase n=1 Tax=Halalkalibaculum sp. DA384 TaxID=3373606 RepID=UPI00375453D8
MWGIVFLLIGILGFLIYWLGNRKLGRLLFVAYIARAAAALIHQYVFILPAGCCDAFRFEANAWQWSQYSGDVFLELFNPSSSYVISWLGALLYSVFGRDMLLLQMFNVFLGTITVYVVYKIADEFLEQRYAYIAAWLFALHPTVIEHSAVFLREVQVILFLSLGILYFVKWLKTNRSLFVVNSFLFTILSSFFHGGMVFGILVMAIVVGGVILSRYLRALETTRVKKGTFLTTAVVTVGIVVLSMQGLPELSTVGDLSRLLAAEQAADAAGTAVENRAHGGAAYLTGMAPGNPLDIIWQAPIRVVYFLFSPFPWDISSITHLKGFIDSGFLIYISYIMWKYRRELWANDIFRYLFYILLLYVFVFSYGTSNFGSAIRHKSKFMPIIVMFYGLKQYHWRKE